MTDGLGAAMAAAHNREKADEALKRVAALEKRLEALEAALRAGVGQPRDRLIIAPSGFNLAPGDINPYP